MDEKKLIEVYNFFTEEGYDLGGFDKFKSDLLIDSPQREEIYMRFDGDGYDIGDFNDFFLSPSEDTVSVSGTGGSEELIVQDPKTEQFRNTQLGSQPQTEKDTAIERIFGKGEVTDFFGDLYRSGVQGINQGATVDDAISLFAQGKNVSEEDLQEYIAAVNQMESFGPSEEMQDFSKIYQEEGKGVYGFLKGVANNPTVLPQLFTSSIAAMLNPASLTAGAIGAAGGTAVAPGIGTIAGGIAGVSGALETGLAYTEFLKEELEKKGLEFNEEGIRTILEDEDAMDSIQNRSLGRGFSIAAIDALTGGLAAGVTRRAALKTGRALAGAAGAGVEAAGGATGEVVARLAAGQEMDVAEVGFEAVTGTATAPLSVAVGLSKPARYKLNGGEATLKQVQTLLNKGTAQEIAATDISIENNSELKKLAETKKQDVILERDLRNVFPDIPDEGIKELLPLEKRRRALIDNPTKSAANELKKVDEKIDEITNKYTEDAVQKPSTEEVDVSQPTQDSPTVGEGDTQGTAVTRETETVETEQTSEPADPTQVETQIKETQEITYTLPEDPNDIANDFEIIDNRNEKAGLEINEDGQGKWYVRNKKTDSILPTKSKKEAELNIKPENINSWDYGEGMPVIQETLTETAESDVEGTEITEEDFVELKTLSDPNISQSQKNKAFNRVITRLTKKGKTLTRTAAALIKKVKTLDVNDPVGVKNVLDKINKVFTDADTKQKIDKAKDLQNKISKQTKNLKDNSMVMAAKEFVLLDPFLADNLDAFIEQAEKINNGLGKSTIGKDKVKIKTPFNVRQAQSFVLKQQKAEQKLKQQEQNQAYELLTGLSSKDATLEDIRKALRPDPNTTPAQQERAQKKIEKNKAKIEKGIQKAFNNFKRAALGRIKKPISELTASQKNIIRDFINIDIDKLETTDQKLETIDSLVNFAVNESTGGMQSIVAKYNGIVEAQRLKQEGISAKPFKFIGSKFLGNMWLKWLATTPNVFDLIFKSQSKARNVMRAMGFTQLTNQAAIANRLTNEKITEYVNKYKNKKANGEDYFNEQNGINRGLIAFMRRTVDGTPQEQKAEFERRKQLVEETIKELNNSTNKEFNNQGKLYEIAYKKLLLNSETIEAIESKADALNLEGVETVTETWRLLRPDLQETGLNVYNISLGEDINYTPDNLTVIEETKQEELDFNKPFFDPSNTEYVYSKETGRLIPSTRPTSLKGKDKTRIVNLNFDTFYNRTLRDAYMDINVAPTIQQINGFRNSKFFNDIFPDQRTRQIANDAINEYVASKRGKLNVKGEEVTATNRLNKIASIGVARALAGVTQPIKQLSPFMTTITNAGVANTLAGVRLLSDPNVRESLNKLGAGINLRGIESTASIQENSSLINKLSQSKGFNLGAVGKLSDFALRKLLVNPDVFTARASFLGYYLQSLENQGVDINSLDWKNHDWNNEAVNFAQNQVDRQQNVSDPDLQGQLFRSKDFLTQFGRKVLFPFANFLINQKTRMYADITTLRNNPLPEERRAAFKSLAGLGLESAYFNFLSYIIAQGIVAMSYEFMDEEQSEEDKEQTDKFYTDLYMGNFVADIIDPIPDAEKITKKIINSFLESVSKSDDPTKFFVREKEGLLDQLGALGIGGKALMDTYELLLPGLTGEKITEYRGKKSVKKLTKKEQDIYFNSGLTYLAYTAGLLPAETGRLIRSNIRILNKSPQTINKTLLKKVNPELYDQLYGPGSASYRLRELKKSLKK